MRLSDFSWIRDFEVVRDSEFDYAVKLHSLSPNGGNLIFVQNQSYLGKINYSLVSTVITLCEFADFFLKNYPEVGVAISSNPREVFYKVHIELTMKHYIQKRENQISKTAQIHPKAIIASSNVVIGAKTIIEEGVIIKENVEIGDNCIIQSGTVIGSDCFETAIIDGLLRIIPHAGKVVIGNNVVIQSMCSVSKGLFPTKNTVIEDEVMIADHVHIAHGVHIKKRTRIAAGTVVAGYVTVGNGVWIGPGATISNGLRIGENAFITLGSTVVSDVGPNSRVAGNFAIEYNKFIKSMGRIRKE